MDLLGGYGSDDSGSSGDEAPKLAVPPSTSTAAAAAKPLPTQTSRRGKRIVSLHAVLPTHILDQLEKSTATGDLDSDDEEAAAVTQSTQDAKRHAVVGKDEGLSSFLSELKSAPTTAFLGGGSSDVDEKPAASQPLGQAFTTTSVEVTPGGHEVVDVHAKKLEPAPRAKLVTSKKESGVGDKTSPHVAMPPAPRPSASSVSVPRPGMNRPVVSAPLAPPSKQAPMQQAPYYHTEQVEKEPKKDPRRSKKRSRKEMEAALRSGNLGALEDSDMTTLEAEGSIYVPQEETYAVPSSGAVRVAPVRMYDPKAGTDVVQADVTGKQRGKHQINQLLASAANLELQRARATGTGVKSKRADAKRKYGW